MTAEDGLTRADSLTVRALRPSPNHGPRVDRAAPDCVVLHYTGMADGPSAIRWLCDPASNVSCHYVVEEDGTVLQLVPEARRAWHAGRSIWAGETDLNSASIGIEIVNGGHIGGLPPYPDVQIAALVPLLKDIVARHRMSPSRLLAHSDIAPGRKEDPGERFPWQRLFEAGLGLWVPGQIDDGPALDLGDAGPAVRDLRLALARYGYGVAPEGGYDEALATVVRAFQRRFRPQRIDGRTDAGTRRTLSELLQAMRGCLDALITAHTGAA